MINTVQIVASKKIDESVKQQMWSSRSGMSYADMVRAAVEAIADGAGRIVCNGKCGWKEALVVDGQVWELHPYSQMSITTPLAGDEPRPIGTTNRTAPDEVLGVAARTRVSGGDSHWITSTTIADFIESLA